MTNVRVAIVVNGRFTSQQQTGMQRFATELIRALDERIAADHEFEVEMLLPRNGRPIPYLKAISQRQVGGATGHLWEQLDLPRHAFGKPIVNLCASAPIMGGKELLVIHDAAIIDNPQNYSTLYRHAYRLLWRLLKRPSITIATVSDFSATRLAHYGIADNAPVIPNGCDHMERIASDESVFARFPQIRKHRYLFALGNRSANKNFGIILQALNELNEPDLQLVQSGGTNRAVFGSTAETKAPKCIDVGMVSDGQLKALYSNAFAFLFPSLYEGFGIPPLEAMSVGCPPIVASTSAIPEVCQDGALYFDPSSASELANAIRSLGKNTGMRELLTENGNKRVTAYRWATAADCLLQQLRRLV